MIENGGHFGTVKSFSYDVVCVVSVVVRQFLSSLLPLFCSFAGATCAAFLT